MLNLIVFIELFDLLFDHKITPPIIPLSHIKLSKINLNCFYKFKEKRADLTSVFNVKTVSTK